MKKLRSAIIQQVSVARGASPARTASLAQTNFLPVRTLSDKPPGTRSVQRSSYSVIFILKVCLILFFGLVTSCKGPQLVSSTDNTSKKDSTVSTSKFVSKDSTIDKETVTEKVIPQSSVDFNMGNGARLDSIIAVLKSMPKGVPQIITIPDKNHNAIIQLFIDSLGRMAVRCTSSEKKYYEKDVQKEKYISSLVNQLTQKNIELREKSTEVLQLKKSWWEKVKDMAEHFVVKLFLWLLLICILVIFIELSVRKGKDLIKIIKP